MADAEFTWDFNADFTIGDDDLITCPFEAFQTNAFQQTAFQNCLGTNVPPGEPGGPAGGITSTRKLQKTVDYYIEREQEKEITEYINEYDVRSPDLKERVTVKQSGVVKLDDAEPTYTTRTDHRGYD